MSSSVLVFDPKKSKNQGRCRPSDLNPSDRAAVPLAITCSPIAMNSRLFRPSPPWLRALATLALIALSLAGVVPSLAPKAIAAGGQVIFLNRIAGVVDAPVYDSDGVTRLAGTNYLAQLYAGTTETELIAIDPPTTFRTGNNAGYLSGGTDSTRAIPFIAGGVPAYLQVRVWAAADGTTYEEALSHGGRVTRSNTIRVILGGAGSPPTLPVEMVGLAFTPLGTAHLGIERQPADVSVFSGQTIQLKPTVTGELPMTFQWLFNGNPLEGATLNELSIPNVQTTQAGTYALRISNQYGSLTSRAALVSVTPMPAGALVTFSNRSASTGLDAPVLGLDGVTRLSGSRYVAQLWGGATTNTLAPLGDPVQFLTGANAGYWDPGTNSWRAIPDLAPGATAFVQIRVWDASSSSTYEEATKHGVFGHSRILEIVTGGEGTGNAPASLEGLLSFQLEAAPLPPDISSGPTDVNVPENTPLILNMTVAGTRPFTFTWHFQNQVIPGAVTSTLTIPSAQPENSGDYRLRVDGPGGTEWSSTIHVTVTPNNSGGTVVFANRVQSSVDAPVFDVDGTTRLAGTSFRAQLYAGPTPDALTAVGQPVGFGTGELAGYWQCVTNTLPNVGPAKTGYVQVRVWASSAGNTYEQAVLAGGKYGASAILEVVAGGAGLPASAPATLAGMNPFSLSQKPLVTGTLPDTRVFIGESVSFALQVFSTTPSTLQWQLNGQPLPGADKPTLTLSNLQPAQAGKYRLLATNAAGVTISAEAQLTVLIPPDGASIRFVNRLPSAGLDAPVFAVDGVTLLQGSGFVAQLYAGPDAANLHAAGSPVPFLTGADAGYWDAGLEPWRVLDGVQPGEKVTIQVRVWEAANGLTYEQSLAQNGRTGVSDIIEVVAGGEGAPTTWPATMSQLKSFHLLPPLPRISTDLASHSVFLGESFSLDVSVTNTSALQFTWQRQNPDTTWTTIGTSSLGHIELGQATQATTGVYRVVVSNPAGSVTGTPAMITAVEHRFGGTVNFVNRLVGTLDAPVMDVDGITRLAGAGFVAQLYAGPTAEDLVPILPTSPFRTGNLAGYWAPGTNSSRELPNVGPGRTAFLQVRVWELTAGASFDAAAAASGRVGVSEVFTVVTGGAGVPPTLPADMLGLKPFHLTQRPIIIGAVPTEVFFVGETMRFQLEVRSASPVSLQWTFFGAPIPGANAATLLIPNAQPANAGRYRLVASNAGGIAQSPEIDAQIIPRPTHPSLRFSNRLPQFGVDAPVFGLDGITRLSGTNYLAQLYLGADEASLMPVGTPTPFLTGDDAGYWDPGTDAWMEIQNAAPGATLKAQVRVWEAAGGTTYEETLDNGGLTGKSDLIEVSLSDPASEISFPPPLLGLKSFHITLPLPHVSGEIQHVWAMVGSSGTFRVAVDNSAIANPTYTWQRLSDANEWTNIASDGSEFVNVPATPTTAGAYRVLIHNATGTLISGPKRLILVYPNGAPWGGGQISVVYPRLNSHLPPITGPDGVTPLDGDAYAVQPYAGPSPDSLLPEGVPVPFRTGINAGYFPAQYIALTRVPPGYTAWLQTRIWETAFGDTYEDALANGGWCQVSGITSVITGGAGSPPTTPANYTVGGGFTAQQHLAIVGTVSDHLLFEGESTSLTLAVNGPAGFSASWRKDGVPVPGETNGVLNLPHVRQAQTGTYTLVATNATATVTSTAANITVLPVPQGASIRFQNRVPHANLDAPVFALDGTNRLSGSGFVAQLYAGSSETTLAPNGPAVPFGTAANAGYWDAGATPWRTIENTTAGASVTAQIRVWEAAKGATYEDSLASGGQTGKSAPLVVATGGPGATTPWPAPMTALPSFKLSPALPTIANDPTNVVVYLGDPIELGVLVLNTNGVVYHWQRENTNGVWVTVLNTSNPVLNYNYATTSMAGDYRVVVANETGAVASDAATVTVLNRTRWELGATPGHVEFQLTSPSTGSYVVEASTNLTTWAAIGETTTPLTSFEIADTPATNLTSRFYRLKTKTTGIIVSSNVAGYVRLKLPPGFSMLANPLVTSTNTLKGLIPNPPDGTFVYQYHPEITNYTVAVFDGGEWNLPDEPLVPGDGALVYNPTETTYLVTIAGKVGRPAQRTIPAGWTIQSMPAPIGGRLDTVLKFPSQHMDIIAKLMPTGEFDIYVSSFGIWFPAAPVFNVGESFWAWKTVNTPWTPTWPSP